MEHPLRELRKTLDLNQREFAESINSHPTYISQMETGVQPMGSLTALRVAEMYRAQMNRLGITVEDLLRGSRSRPAPPVTEGGEKAERATG